jgi:hypothetical protein
MSRILLYLVVGAVVAYSVYHFRIVRNRERIQSDIREYVRQIEEYRTEKGAYPRSLREAGLESVFSAGPYQGEIYYQLPATGFWLEFHWGSGLINYTSSTRQWVHKDANRQPLE